jgi:transcriptional regulator with GAF, ATPase, and Fis domain
MRTIRVDFRLIAATNRNLEEMVGTREFRLIYYRLNVSRPDSAATANGVKTS